MSELHVRKGLELVQGWCRYVRQGKVRMRVAREPGGPSYGVVGAAVAFEQLTEEEKAKQSLGGRGSMVFDASDLEARHVVEFVLTQLRIEGFPTDTLCEILTAHHLDGESRGRLKRYLKCPRFETGCRQLGITSELVITLALRELYARVGHVFYAQQAEADQKRAERDRQRELAGKIEEPGELLAYVRESTGLTLEQLAGMGVSSLSALKQYSSNRRAMPVIVAKEIGELLSMDYGWWKNLGLCGVQGAEGSRLKSALQEKVAV